MACANEAKRKGRPVDPHAGERNCAWCGSHYKRSPARAGRYCSAACRIAASRGKTLPHRRVEWRCRECGKTEMVMPHVVKDKKYCCHPCYAKARSTELRQPDLEFSCQACGQTFHPRRAGKDTRWRKYCSRECADYDLHTRRRKRQRSVLERVVEAMLLGLNVEFVPQWRFERWLADFYLPLVNGIVECDGDYWHALPRARQRDMRKEQAYRAAGLPVLHLTETEIMTDIAGCHRRLLEFVGRAPTPGPT